jgi:hypothetical protein
LHIIGIAASSKEDKSSFKITVRGRGTTSKFISASKFFDKFGIDAEDSTVASSLKEVDGIAGFDIEVPSASARKPYTGKPRGAKASNSAN